MDSGSDCNFLPKKNLLRLIDEKENISIYFCNLNFNDVLKRPMIHCSYYVEVEVFMESESFGIQKFYIPDNEDWTLNIVGKNIFRKLYEFKNNKIESKSKACLKGYNINYVGIERNKENKDIKNVGKSSLHLESVFNRLNSEEIKKSKLWPAEINTPKGEFVVIHRKLDDNKIKLAKDTISPLIDKGFISQTKEFSNWINPIQLVPKSDGSTRFCLDLRGLNKLVKQDNYPIPDIANITDCLRDKRIFSKLDIKDGFFHIPLREEDRKKTTFKLGFEKYHFNVLPMGFRNSPNIFQRIMEHILSEYLGIICIVYIDDILVFSENEDTHKEDLYRVLRRLKEYGFVINEDKAEYFKKEIGFLGYCISPNKIKPDHNRTQGIQDFQIPKTVKEVRRFIGLLGYERRFLNNIS